MRNLKLREHRWTHGVALAGDELTALRSRISTLSVSPASDRGRYDLKPGAQVGSLDVGGLRVRIVPKVPVDRVLFLLAYSSNPRVWDPKTAFFGEHEDLVEAVAVGFVHQVRRALRQGLLQGYRTKDEALAGLRGRVRIEDQVRRRFGRFPPAEVRYDDFTVDIEENRVLKAAVSRLSRLDIRADETRRALRALSVAFADVTPVRYSPRRLPEIAFTRLNRRYRGAIELAKSILRSTSFDLAGDGIAARGFLVDMNTLFEDFVVSALREALGLSAKSFPQNAHGKRFRLDERGAIPLEPDISWWEGPMCRFVGDVKYKRSHAGRGPNADVYQVLSYAVAADLSDGLLIYASGEAEPGIHVVRHLGMRIELRALDLSVSPPEILQQIGGLAERVRASCR